MTAPTNNIPPGLCQCGCSRKTKRGNKFLNGHNAKLFAHPRPSVTFGFIEGEEVAYIPLTQGKFAIVDAELEPLFREPWSFVNGYAMRGVNGKLLRMHNVIHNNSGLEPDHKNRNKLDNRRSNLRTATRAQNVHNQGPKSNHPTGYKGVTNLPNGKFRSRISVDGVDYNLGCFLDPVEAAKAHDAAALRLCGEFAYLNFPEEKECQSHSLPE